MTRSESDFGPEEANVEVQHVGRRKQRCPHRQWHDALWSPEHSHTPMVPDYHTTSVGT